MGRVADADPIDGTEHDRVPRPGEDDSPAAQLQVGLLHRRPVGHRPAHRRRGVDVEGGKRQAVVGPRGSGRAGEEDRREEAQGETGRFHAVAPLLRSSAGDRAGRSICYVDDAGPTAGRDAVIRSRTFRVIRWIRASGPCGLV